MLKIQRFLLGLALAAIGAGTLSAKTTYEVGRMNMNDDPSVPLIVHQYYKTTYTAVIYVADIVYLSDGTPAYVIENIRGRYCLITSDTYARSCVIPVTEPAMMGLLYLVSVKATTVRDAS